MKKKCQIRISEEKVNGGTETITSHKGELTKGMAKVLINYIIKESNFKIKQIC